jgi:uncharacterized protein (DUF1810 family)
MSLKRFQIAQADPASGFDVAISELRHGRKVSHWIWYIFPQLRGLGRSSTAQFYAIDNLVEAQEYLRDAILRKNLLSAMETVARHLFEGAQLETVMGGSVDSFKLVSCATLFRVATEFFDDFPEVPDIAAIHQMTGELLEAAEAQGFPPCPQTLSLIQTEGLGHS